MADQKISLTISGKDELTPAATTAASSIKKVGDHADEAKAKVKSFGEQMNDLRPKGETLAVGMQAVALAVGTVAGVFYKAAGASEALGGKMKAAGDAANSSLGALGDAIAKSGAFNSAMDSILRGMGDFTEAIGKNQKAVDDLIRAGIDPLTIAFKTVTKIVGGLAMVGLLASETLGPVGNLLIGIQRQSMAVFEFIYKSWANLAAFMTNNEKPFPDFDPFAGGKQALEGAMGLYGIASGDARIEQRLNRIINTMEAAEAAADQARDAALGAGSAAAGTRSAPMRSGEVWPFDQEPTEQSVLRPEGGGRPKTGGGRGGLRSTGGAAAKYDWGQDIYRPFYEDWSRPEADDREVGPQWKYDTSGEAWGPSDLITDEMRWAREEEVKPLPDEWRNTLSGLVSSSQQLGDVFARLAFTSMSVDEGLQSIIPGVAGMLGSVAQTLVPGLGGQAIGAGIGILGSVIGAMMEGKSSRRREYTTDDPLPVKVVNKEELQQVTVYNLTVAGAGQSALMQQQQLGRSVSRALNAARRSGAARLAPAGA